MDESNGQHFAKAAEILEQAKAQLEAIGMQCMLSPILLPQGYTVSLHVAQTELAVSRLAQDAEARCAQWLLHHAKEHAEGGLRVTLNARKRLIAAQLGIAPETFSRVLRQLREHGLIAGRGNVIDLPKPQALELLALS